MASNHGNTHSELPNSEQIITELFCKILQIILESRCPPHVYSQKFRGEKALISPPPSSSSSSSSSSIRSKDKWFNLAIRDCPAVLEKRDFQRQTNFELMVIDVILVRPSSEKIIERWVVQYVSSKEDCSSSAKRGRSTCLHALYRKSILLLRSLYSVLRLLPIYKFFHDLNSSCQIAHRVSTFAEPFTRVEESEMKQFLFTSLETISGRLSISVLYIPSIPESNSDSDQLSSRLPISSPQVISQYIGSPLSNPSKKLPSLVCSPSPPPPLSIALSRLASNHGLLPLPLSGSRSDRKSHLAQNNPSTDDKQQCPDGKSSSSESGRHSAVNTSFSSRLSLFENKFDDSEFCGAFVVDEDMTSNDSTSASCRKGYFDGEKGGKQDAAVGALIQMLNRAAPLHGGVVVKPSKSGVQSKPNRMNRASSGVCSLGKTTADALEELRGYRDVKQSGVAAKTTFNLP